MPLIQGQIINPSSGPSYPDGTTSANMLQGRVGELIDSNLHGKWYEQTIRGAVFWGGVTGVTLPVIASGLVSVVSLYNPAGSQKNLELISVSVGTVLATTAVDNVNLYFQAGIGSSTAIPTGITVGTANSGLLTPSSNPQGKFLTAATHVGALTLLAQVANFGAVTTNNFSVVTAEFDGKIILPPGSIITPAMSTVASTAAGIAVGICWAESPL